MSMEYGPDRNRRIFQFAKHGSPEEMRAHMKEIEETAGLKDFHVEVHINEEEVVRLDTFFVTGYHESGQILFMGKADRPINEMVHLLARAITEYLGILAQILSIPIAEVSKMVGTDKLMEDIEKHVKGQG